MFDNGIIQIIISTISSQLSTAGVSGLSIKQSFQPTQQGVNTQPTAYFFKIGDRRIGSPSREDVWDSVNLKMVHTESQWYETSFQISVLSTQDPTNTSQMTASDICNALAYILQSSQTIDTFINQGLGLLNVMQVRNMYFVDDRGRHEALPSFDFTITHKQTISNDIDVLQSTEIGIYPI